MLCQSKEASRHIVAVLSALDILDCFQTKGSLTMKEIVELTGLTRSRVMRLLGTLESRGYIVCNAENKTFYPGCKLPIIAKAFHKNNWIEVFVQPVLKRLVKDLGESATFYVRDRLDRVTLAREDGRRKIRYVTREGERKPLWHGGAASNILLAYGPHDLVEDVRQFSGNDLSVIESSIHVVRKNGHAVSQADNSTGATCIVAPVFNAEGQLTGALAVSGPSSRMTDEQIKICISGVASAAGLLSERLGHNQAY